MTHGPTFYPSRGRCIYCGRAEAVLLDEHVVPFSLGGQHILRQASCEACRQITETIEHKIARDLWGDGDARGASGARARQRAPLRPDIAMMDEAFDVVSDSVDNYPGGFIFYKMAVAGLLRGVPESEDASASWGMVVVEDEERRRTFLKKYARPLTLRFRHVRSDFGRMLAKIAYCQALTVLEPENFQAFCLPYILGERSNLSYIVGGTPWETEPISDVGFSLSTGTVDLPAALLVVVTIRLLANTHAPGYLVVAGAAVGDQIERVRAKLGVG